MMDFILNIFKQISQSVSPSELLMLLVAVILAAIIIAKFFFGLASKKGALGGFLGGDDEAVEKEKMNQQILDKLSSLITKEEFDRRTKDFQDEIIEAAASSAAAQLQKISEFSLALNQMLMLKTDMKKTISGIQEDIKTVMYQMRTHDASDDRHFTSLKDLLQRNQDTVARVQVQVEKVDEFTKAIALEFRNDHRVHVDKINHVIKDIALMERTVQTQINNAQSIKLR